MVNVCGHTLCESCVDLLFVRGAGNCPECGTPLRKSNFRVQLFEDPTVDKEVEIRKKVLKIYNKREEDFPSLREYNDFLEEVEEIVFNLTNNVDLENTKKKMEIYQKENKDVIQKNKLKLTREQEELEEALEVERQESEQRRLFIQKEEELQQILKRKNKQAFLDELESSDLPVALLLAQHKDRSTQLEMQLEKPRAMKPVTFSTGIKMGSLVLIVYLKDSFQDYAFKFFSTFYSKVNGLDIKEQGQQISLAPIQKLEEALYEYQPLQIETCGPQVPEQELLGRLGYLNHVRAASPQDLAGGYTSSLACHRALQDAFSGLFWQPR
ncbi:CDK-activating kinase assembly factor MAT1 [Apodemus speciosus]|uniref:CDK-activating kinase assembly factor MAT1 n=2 Tax=Muroidea TaxID=337687 RepID=A0ABQ0FE36_APOSI